MIAGYATIALDAPRHGKRAVENGTIIIGDLKTTRDLWVEAVVDYRYALDYLAAREDIDMERVVLLGASMGGILGILLTAADERIDAAAILIAGGDLTRLAAESEHPMVLELQEAIEKEGRTEASRILSDIDPVNWAGKISPRPILFVNGLEDDIIPKSCAEALIRAAKEPKQAVWDDVGHTVSPETLLIIYEWLRENTPATAAPAEQKRE